MYKVRHSDLQLFLEQYTQLHALRHMFSTLHTFKKKLCLKLSQISNSEFGGNIRKHSKISITEQLQFSKMLIFANKLKENFRM